ncbi:MAG: proline racemase family protein [Proteobacteria bacterium]|nr:proline racemase family protein [Pseudomonadota bacterium]
MRRARFVDTIYTHTSGGPLCIVHSGIAYEPGSDIVAKRAYLMENFDWLRTSLMCEPRGYTGMVGAFFTPTHNKESHGGVVWMSGDGWLKGCGHGTIALAMAMVAEGWLPSTGSITPVRLETIAGVTAAEVATEGDDVKWCRLENVPAFPVAQDVKIEIPEIGMLNAHVAFGGNFFGIVKWEHPEIRIAPENGAAFRKFAAQVKRALAEKIKVRHPLHSHIEGEIDLITFYNHDTAGKEAFVRNMHVSPHGHIARSPGGTALSALLSVFEAQGAIKMGQPVVVEGFLGPQYGYFEGEAVRATEVAGHRAIVTRVKGSANILGYAKWLLDPADPASLGFRVG